MDYMRSIADEKIREAIRRGEFNNLPGAGKPLPPDDMENVPEELRLGFKLLKNAGMIPEEMQLRKDMVTLEDLLAVSRDETERAKLRGELSARKLRYRSLLSDRGWHVSDTFAEYEDKMQERLAEKEKPST